MNIHKPQWFEEIERNSFHILYHDTSFECARSILRHRRIHGVRGWHTSHEGFPHLMYKGWPQKNHLPVPFQIRLYFSNQRPARLRGKGTNLPEPGYLEVYEDFLGAPWQCSLHPDGSPLTFIGSNPSARDLAKSLPPLWSSSAWKAKSFKLRALCREIQKTKGEAVCPVLI